MGLDVTQRLAAVLDHALAAQPAAFLVTGDCCAREPEQEVYRQLRTRLDALAVPYYLVAGNHDSRTMMRNGFFLEGHGEQPIYGLVEIADRHFLLLDTSRSRLDAEQLAWLGLALQQYPAADIVMHHPPIPMGNRFMDRKHPLKDTSALLDILTTDGLPRRVFCGHYHGSHMAHYRNLQVYLCPPTSFFIDPCVPEFRQQALPPAYQQLEWQADGTFRATAIYVN